MGYNKAEYEKLITASPLFSLDRDKQPAAFRRESYKMVEYLYCYLLAVNEKAYEPYGCEITEVAIRCINNYDNSKGIFLHYFNAAWKLEYGHLRGDQAIEEKLHGIRITEEEKRFLKRCLRYEASIGRDLTQIEIYETLAEMMGRSVEEILQLAELLEYHIVDNEMSDDEGTTASLFDQLSDGRMIDDNLLAYDGVCEILTAIETTFLSIQQRQKPIVSDMMTIRVASIVLEAGVSKEAYTFLASDIMQGFIDRQTLPTQREIAAKYGKNEASISRTVKEFINKLKTVTEQKG